VGFRLLMAAGPAVTVNPLLRVTTSPPVVRVMFQKPVAAVGVMVDLYRSAGGVVDGDASDGDSGAETRARRSLHEVSETAQHRYRQIALLLRPRARSRRIEYRRRSIHGEAVSERSVSPAVVIVTVRRPVPAAGSMLIIAVALVALFTVSD